jgi:hypothetical protein
LAAAVWGAESGGTVTVISSAERGNASAPVARHSQASIPFKRTALVTGDLPPVRSFPDSVSFPTEQKHGRRPGYAFFMFMTAQ